MAKKKSTYLKYDNNRLEKSRLQHNYRYLTCKKLTRQGGKKTSRPSEDAKIDVWKICRSVLHTEETNTRKHKCNIPLQ